MTATQGGRGPYSLRRGLERYEKEKETFRQATKDNLDLAQEYYGFTLTHSLSRDEGTDLLEALGFEAKDATEQYNRGVVAAQKENYKKAIEHFRHAVEADSSLLDAVYNLAVCYERTKQYSQAVSTWQTYLDSVKEHGVDAEVKSIKDRIAELKKQQKQ